MPDTIFTDDDDDDDGGNQNDNGELPRPINGQLEIPDPLPDDELHDVIDMEVGFDTGNGFVDISDESNVHTSGDSDNARSSGISIPRERRQRILMGILYQRFLGSRRGQIDNSAHRDDEIERPPIRLLSPAETSQREVVCRFCLDTSQSTLTGSSTIIHSEESSVNHESRFIAPCACIGTAEFVHLDCLRRWQLSALEHASVCSVCTTPYALRPPALKEDLVKPGSLLIFQDESVDGSRSLFFQAVILMTNGGACETPIGIILNKPDAQIPVNDPTYNPCQDVRRGGPVCGGRYGVTRYIVLHTFGADFPLGDEENTMEHDGDHRNTNMPGLCNKKIIDTTSVVFVDEHALEPAMMGGSRLHDTLNRFSGTTDSQRPIEKRYAAFKGCCKWSKNQLRAELLRGSWAIGTAAQYSDIWNTSSTSWSTLFNGNRLTPKLEWFDCDAEDLDVVLST